MAPGLRKPVWVHQRLMDRIEAWLRVAQTPDEWIGIIRIVQVLFMKTGMDHSVDDMTITTRSFTVSPAYLRRKRLRAASRCLSRTTERPAFVLYQNRYDPSSNRRVL